MILIVLGRNPWSLGAAIRVPYEKGNAKGRTSAPIWAFDQGEQFLAYCFIRDFYEINFYLYVEPLSDCRGDTWM